MIIVNAELLAPVAPGILEQRTLGKNFINLGRRGQVMQFLDHGYVRLLLNRVNESKDTFSRQRASPIRRKPRSYNWKSSR